MGANNSMLKQSSVTDITTNVLNSSISNFLNSQSVSGTSTQILKIDNSNIKCKSLTIGNESKTTMGVLLSNTNDAANNIANAATTEAQNQLSSKVDQSNSGIPMLQFNNNMTWQDVRQTLKTTLATQLVTNITNNLKVDSTNTQILLITGNIDIDGPCDITQKSVQDMIVQSTVEGAIKQLIDNKVLSKTASTMSSDVTQSNTFTLLGFIGGGIFGFIILIGIIYMIFKKKSDGSSTGK